MKYIYTFKYVTADDRIGRGEAAIEAKNIDDASKLARERLSKKYSDVNILTVREFSK